MVYHGTMNNTTLGMVLVQILEDVEGEPGLWQAEVDGLPLYVVADETHDRMRIMIPVGRLGPDDKELMWELLSANYGRALDAKYALHDDIVWSTFMHQLSTLTQAVLENAVEHVVTLAQNTGTTFASSDLLFGDDD